MSAAAPGPGATAGDRVEAGQRRLQMTDIARLAGVSTATVSRALSGSRLVNAATRERIVALARSLNYRINVGAQSLRLGHSRTIAVVLPYEGAFRQAVSDPFFLALLGSVADAVTDQGYDMLLSRIEADQLDQAASYCEDGRAMGVILFGQWHHHEQLNRLALRGQPLVVWGARLPQQVYCTVGSDNVKGGRIATEALLGEGRQRIAFLGDRGLAEVEHRHQGYLQAHRALGMVADPELCVPASFLWNGGRAAVAALLDRQARFDGLFACSDLIAMSAIAALNERGLRVPDDVSVVGYDDVPLARALHPRLTTVRQAIEDGGRLLVEALLQLIREGSAESRMLETTLIVRGTTRPGGTFTQENAACCS